jgi:hypothetical protein
LLERVLGLDRFHAIGRAAGRFEWDDRQWDDRQRAFRRQ